MKKKNLKQERVWTNQERLLIKFMAMAGVPRAQIAKYFKTRKDTLLRECREELEDGVYSCNAQIVGALFKSAMKGNVAAQIFWCKTRLGWREKSEIEHTGSITPVLNLIRAETNINDATNGNNKRGREQSRDIH